MAIVVFSHHPTANIFQFLMINNSQYKTKMMKKWKIKVK